MNYIFRSRYGDENFGFTYGLWRSCPTNLISTLCFPIYCGQGKSSTGSYCMKILTARAFVTLACIMSGVSALCLCLSVVTNEKIRHILLMTGKVLAFTCLIVGIIGVAVGIDVSTSNGNGQKLKLGAASIIGIIVLIINLWGAIASLFIK